MFFKHTKTGKVYKVLHLAHVEATPWFAVVVYQSVEDGSIWTRPTAEFFGKTKLPPPQGTGRIEGEYEGYRFVPVPPEQADTEAS